MESVKVMSKYLSNPQEYKRDYMKVYGKQKYHCIYCDKEMTLASKYQHAKSQKHLNKKYLYELFEGIED